LSKRPRTQRRATARLDLSKVKGARPAPFPGFIEPCHPTLRPKLPQGALWQFEIKFDGYRVQLHRHQNTARAFTRSGLDWSEQFALLCEATAAIPASSIVLDGEAPDWPIAPVVS
jgi:bifunctional non-homologous end joining protein LigD